MNETTENTTPEAEASLNKSEKVKQFFKKNGKYFIGAGCVVLAGYALVFAYFDRHTFPNTSINKTDYSNMLQADIEKAEDTAISKYTLTIKEANGDPETITAADISLTYAPDGEVQKIIDSQNSLLWPLEVFTSHAYDVSYPVSYDEDQLDAVISDLSCLDKSSQTDPVNAKAEYKDGKFVITDAVPGTALKKATLKEAIQTAITNLDDSIDLEADGLYTEPAVTAETTELVDGVNDLNTWLSAKITYTFPDGDEDDKEVINSKQIAKWISFDEKKMKATIKKSAITTYVSKLAAKYNVTNGERKFKTASGDKVTISGGDCNWTIDETKEQKTIISNIKKGKEVTRKFKWSSKEGSYVNSGIGTTYAEVDLTNQHMYFIKDGKIALESDVVTGNPNKGNETPPGVFSVTFKKRDTVLRGPKKNGKYTYQSPVKYWMPFNRGIGFHDASWQSSFGGTRYLSHGSHGCVNMPTVKAGQLYDLIEKGTTVVVYDNP